MTSPHLPVMVDSGRSRWTANVRPSLTTLDSAIKLLPEMTRDSFSAAQATVVT